MKDGDLKLKKHVEDELSWEPSVNAAAIGVGVTDAIVTLSGYVDSYAAKQRAEGVVMGIHGVRALANELEVRLPIDNVRKDEDIARTAASVLSWNIFIPQDRIKVQVSHGVLTLEGDVDWHYQKILAEAAMNHLMGVKSIQNRITIKAKPLHKGVQARIESALKRNAEMNARRIQVRVEDHEIVLSGTVQSLRVRQMVEQAAWKAPGVSRVINNITVSPAEIYP